MLERIVFLLWGQLKMPEVGGGFVTVRFFLIS